MVQTNFSELVDKYLKKIVAKLGYETWNGKAKKIDYLFPKMLDKEYSVDMTFASASIQHSIVSADVVSMDSSLPLKKRESLRVVNGSIPKLGMKYAKDEKFISDLNRMIAVGTLGSEVVNKLFKDTESAVEGIDMAIERMFLSAISTGAASITDQDGQLIRITFPIPEANFMVSTVANWSASGAKPVSDLRAMFNKADEDGVVPAKCLLASKTLNEICASEEGKVLYSNYAGFAQTTKNAVSKAAMKSALKDEFGCDFEEVNTSVRIEKNGTYTNIKPFDVDNVVIVPSEKVGRIVYGSLAEETNPVAGVTYAKAGSYTLVSKYAKNDPLQEFTASQAIVCPVLDGCEGIYIFDTEGKA